VSFSHSLPGVGARTGGLLGLALLALASSAPGALAVSTRYVATDGSAADASCNPTPCSLAHGVNDAAPGDEVVVAPGNYPVTSTLHGSTLASIHGVPGMPRPRLLGATDLPEDSDGNAVTLEGAAVVRHLYVSSTAGSLDGSSSYSHLGGVALTVGPALVEDVVIVSGQEGVTTQGSTINGEYATLRNDVIHATNRDAILAFDNRPTVRNVTAMAPNGDAIHVVAPNGAAVTVRNSILRGVKDLQLDSGPAGFPYQPTPSADAFISYSNYRPAKVGFGALASGGDHNFQDQGHNQTAVDPKFVDAAGADYHQAAGSPTIDAGLTDPLNGPTDFDGDARALGRATDIGADEFVPPKPVVPPQLPPPCVVPKLKGKSLAKAKSALKAAHCKLGTVRKPKPRPHHHLGRLVVVRQSIKAGAHKPAGTRIGVRLGPKH
jgi:hypothetical protein